MTGSSVPLVRGETLFVVSKRGTVPVNYWKERKQEGKESCCLASNEVATT